MNTNLEYEVLIFLKEKKFKLFSHIDNMYYTEFILRDKSYETLHCTFYVSVISNEIKYWTATKEYGTTRVMSIINISSLKEVYDFYINYNENRGFKAKLQKLLE